jgi:hypothetical protein
VVRASRVGVLVATLIFAVVVSEGSPGGLFRRGPFSSDFFDAQARSLLEGRLDVPPEVAGLEGFVQDDRTYLYFGLVPALLRVPVVAFTTAFDGRLTQLSMLAALALATSASGRILWRARRRCLGDAPVATWEAAATGVFVASVGVSSPLLFLAARPLAYHEVELWGTATVLLSIEATLAWWDRPSPARLAVASAAATIALNTRGSVGGGAVAALAFVMAVALVAKRLSWRALPWAAVALLVPMSTYAAVNVARFGTPASVPFEAQVQSSFDPKRQAALEATDGSLFGPEFVPTALVTYLRPDGVRFQALAPWITFRESTSIIGDAQFDTVDRSASLPVVAPGFIALASIGLASIVRTRRADPWLPLVAGTLGGLVPTLTIAIIAQRYLADFTPMLVALAAIGLWPAAMWWSRRARKIRGPLLVALVALIGAGSLVSTALALQAQRLLLLPDRATRLEFIETQFDIHQRLHGGRPPGVVRTDSVASVDGYRGAVAILGDCDALYWHDGERWWPQELAADAEWRLRGDPGQGRTTLVAGDGWSLVAEVSGDEVHFAYVEGTTTTARGQPVPLSGAGDLVVRLDAINSEAFVDIDGKPAVVAWLVDVSGPIVPGPRWEATGGLTPLCDDLSARLAEHDL